MIKYIAAAVSAVFLTSAANAATVMTTGAGSAVASSDAEANFEDNASLGANYDENGLNFQRVGISSNNNSCGFAGCLGFPTFANGVNPFTDNYFYGIGTNNDTTDGILITSNIGVLGGLELLLTSGNTQEPHTIIWESYLGAALVGSGSMAGVSFLTDGPQFFGWADTMSGFDSLFLTVISSSGVVGPAIDRVSVSLLSDGTIPLPAAAPLFLFGAAGLTYLRRRRKA